jgi:hypothetical protein
MVKSSRLITTTILGLVFGIIWMLLTRYLGEPIAFWPLGISWLIALTVMGVAIGASALRMHWAAHGTFWGALFGVFLAIAVVGAVPYPSINFGASVIWGFLIELLATKAFKQPQAF